MTATHHIYYCANVPAGHGNALCSVIAAAPSQSDAILLSSNQSTPSSKFYKTEPEQSNCCSASRYS